MSIQHHSATTMLGKPPVYLEPVLATALALAPANASAVVAFTSTGNVTRAINGGAASTLFAWLKSGAAGDYDIRVTMTGGTNFSGAALATWLSLGTSRSWSLSRSTIGATTGSASVEIRRNSTGVVLATGSLDIQAEQA